MHKAFTMPHTDCLYSVNLAYSDNYQIFPTYHIRARHISICAHAESDCPSDNYRADVFGISIGAASVSLEPPQKSVWKWRVEWLLKITVGVH